MPTYVMNGDKFVATDAKDLVKQLAGAAMLATDETGWREYMEGVASRAGIAASVAVRCDSPDHFVADLVQHGLITVEN